MPDDEHIKVIDKKVTELSNALAHLGKGTDLKELLRIIRFPGWTTPAELAFVIGMIETMHLQVNVLTSMSTQLLAASKKVAVKEAVAR